MNPDPLQHHFSDTPEPDRVEVSPALHARILAEAGPSMNADPLQHYFSDTPEPDRVEVSHELHARILAEVGHHRRRPLLLFPAALTSAAAVLILALFLSTDNTVPTPPSEKAALPAMPLLTGIDLVEALGTPLRHPYEKEAMALKRDLQKTTDFLLAALPMGLEPGTETGSDT